MKFKLHPFVRGAHGSLGDLVFYDLNGEPVGRRKAKFVDKPTPGRLAHRERVKQAARWSKATLADPKQKADYAAACRGHQTPYNIAFRDFMTPPTIQAVHLEGYTGQKGQPIRVKASDDFEVTQVQLALRDGQNNVIEQGPAQWNATDQEWVYLTQSTVAPGQSVLVEATAMDRPGNRTQASQWQYLPPS